MIWNGLSVLNIAARTLRRAATYLSLDGSHCSMPVAGIDEGRASYVLFALRRIASTPEVSFHRMFKGAHLGG